MQLYLFPYHLMPLPEFESMPAGLHRPGTFWMTLYRLSYRAAIGAKLNKGKNCWKWKIRPEVDLHQFTGNRILRAKAFIPSSLSFNRSFTLSLTSSLSRFSFSDKFFLHLIYLILFHSLKLPLSRSDDTFYFLSLVDYLTFSLSPIECFTVTLSLSLSFSLLCRISYFLFLSHSLALFGLNKMKVDLWIEGASECDISWVAQ